MIQPINALSPRAVFRGTNGTYGRTSKGLTSSNIALINAGGVAAAAGGLTTALSRGYTTSWAHAIVIGLCASFLSMFFMTPQLIEKTGMAKLAKSPESELLVKDDVAVMAQTVKKNLRPVKKLVQFRQQT